MAAAPSGHTRSPSLTVTSRIIAAIASSVTSTAMPLDSRRIRSTRKSPRAFGTRMPAANVVGSGQGSDSSLSSWKAFTIGAQPLAWTATKRGSLSPSTQPILRSS